MKRLSCFTLESRALIWKHTIIGAIAGTVLVLLLFLLGDGDSPVLYFVFVVLPCAAMLALFFFMLLFYPNSRRRAAALLLLVGVLLTTAIAVLRFQPTLRPAMRWAFLAHKYKTKVMAQPLQHQYEFRHVEWDGWGGAPVGDWTAYVVFDPADSLARAANQRAPKNIPGIPCDVLEVHRLEQHWYSVTLEMNEWWEKCKTDTVR